MKKFYKDSDNSFNIKTDLKGSTLSFIGSIMFSLAVLLFFGTIGFFISIFFVLYLIKVLVQRETIYFTNALILERRILVFCSKKEIQLNCINFIYLVQKKEFLDSINRSYITIELDKKKYKIGHGLSDNDLMTVIHHTKNECKRFGKEFD